ncbi:MAG: hypothetical protein R3E42_01240 [Burkholderiaceae bacterium]
MFPKTSLRAITSLAGTADTMEILANVEMLFEQLTDRAPAPWLSGLGRTADLLRPTMLISVEFIEHRLPRADGRVDFVEKVAAGATHLVLDISIGPTAKVRSMPEAQSCAACSSTWPTGWACRWTWW